MTRAAGPLRHLLAAVAAAVAGALAPLPAAADSAATVAVRANAFTPFESAVDPGGTVTWVLQEGGHTIVADDGRFAFRGEGSGALAAGTTVSFQVGAQDDVIPYYCEIHGGAGLAGMAGRIRVGDPAPPPPSPDAVIGVPDDQPTLAAALAAAGPGHRIEIAPGTYRVSEPVEVAGHDITIAGTGGDPSAVVLVPAPGQRGFPASALHVTGSHVSIANLSVRGFPAAGVHLDGASAASLSDVRVDGEGFTLDGIAVTGVTGATLQRTATTAARRAGVRVSDCAACGVLIDGARSSTNLVGLLIESGRGVIVRRASVTDNAAGVVVRADRAATPLRPGVVTVHASEIRDNTSRQPLAGARSQDRLLAVGAGVWLSGVADSVVAGNAISGNGYGVAVAGDVAVRTAVTANQLAGNADTDLAWDGLGAAVCFAGNKGSGATPTSDPPLLEDIASCDEPSGGLVYPIVEARLLLRALQGGTP